MSPPELKGGGDTRQRVRVWGSPNSDDGEKAQHSVYSVGSFVPSSSIGTYRWRYRAISKDLRGVKHIWLFVYYILNTDQEFPSEEGNIKRIVLRAVFKVFFPRVSVIH